MSDRSPAPSERPDPADPPRQAPPPEAVEFIRFCHRRRHVGWPELYDEMCAVASRRLYNGWGFQELADIGIGFSLFETPTLAALAREIATDEAERRARGSTAPAKVDPPARTTDPAGEGGDVVPAPLRLAGIVAT